MKKVIIHNLKTIPKNAAFYWNLNPASPKNQATLQLFYTRIFDSGTADAVHVRVFSIF